MNPHSYTHHFFDKGTKNIVWANYSLFNKCCWEKWLSICNTFIHLQHVYHPVLVSTQNGSRTLISDVKL
jgi:hypothetical protein